MSQKDWWSPYGSFERWELCPSRPDPLEVLKLYLDRRGICGSMEQVLYLMDLLGFQKSMAYTILQGKGGLDSIWRFCQLVKSLKIYPPFLVIDAKYYSIEHYAY